jgi:hypothetical protein
MKKTQEGKQKKVSEDIAAEYHFDYSQAQPNRFIGQKEVPVTNLIVNQVVEQMNTLPPKLQRRVLNYAEALNKSGKRGVAGRKLLKFSGAIAADELAAMKKAIETDCEQVNPNEW